MIGEAHLYNDIDCTQYSLCSAMETRSCTVRGVSSSSYSYHDAVQKAANPSQLLPLYSCVVDGQNVGIVFCHPRLCTETLNNYWRLLKLIFIFTIYKRTLFYFVDFYCLCINLVFICDNREVIFELEPVL